jgi:hypothetical protein
MSVVVMVDTCQVASFVAVYSAYVNAFLVVMGDSLEDETIRFDSIRRFVRFY